MNRSLLFVVGILLISFGVDEYYQPATHHFIPVKFVVGIICVLTTLFLKDESKTT